MSLLAARAIRKSFAGVHALRGVSFDLQPGEVHALVGENGAGKSTLLRIITGAEVPDSGSLVVRGQDVAGLTPATARAMGVAMAYQQPTLCPDLTVAENISLALGVGHARSRVDWPGMRARATALLAQLGSSIDPERQAASLSLPEQQLVEIARAIGAPAAIVLFDEPTASLTTRDVASLFATIRSLRERGAGVIYVSHRLDEVFAIADRVTILRDGETVATHRREDLTEAAVVQLMVGRELATVYPKQATTAGAIALDIRGVSSRSSGLRDVSLSVRRGEILGLAGLVGSGRTELAEAIFGLATIDTGEIFVGAQQVRVTSAEVAVRHGLAYVPEDRRRHGVVAGMTITANTTLASLASVSRFGLIQPHAERDLTSRYASQLQVKAASIDDEAGTLSGGNQQKVALARWLATKPTVLILDEPTQGIDVGAKAEIHGIMQDLASRGMAILMISSDLTEVLAMSDRIAVMRGGAIEGVLTRAEATPEGVLRLALGRATGAAAC
jgi:rhamnose transport system ATP-binding protein